MARFFVGLDLGQASDYTALAVLERLAQPGKTEAYYHVRHLERVRNVPYPDVVDKTLAMMRSPALAGTSALVVDQTGVGAPVVDLFRRAHARLNAVLIHGGDTQTSDGQTWRVPKRNLAGVLQVLFQSGRLKISKKLPLAGTLQAELMNFKVKIDPVTAHDSYSAWREADHDDLVLAVALACWYAETAAPKPQPQLVMPRATEKIKPAWLIGSRQGYQTF